MDELLEAKVSWLIDRCQSYYNEFRPADEEEIRDFIARKFLRAKDVEDLWYGLQHVYEHRKMPSMFHFGKAYDHMFGRETVRKSSRYEEIIQHNKEVQKKWKEYSVKKVYTILHGIQKKLPAERSATDIEFFFIYSDVYWETKYMMDLGANKEDIGEHVKYILESINRDSEYRTRRGMRMNLTDEEAERLANSAVTNIRRKDG